MPQGLSFGDRAAGRDNNFNLIRMIAASGVLVSHAWPITYGGGVVEPLESELHGITLGTVCVYIFFAISGFFITKSFDRSVGIGRFLLARALRLFPALIVVLCLTVLAGLWLTTAPVDVYLAAVPDYLLRNLTLFRLQYVLPGVIAEHCADPAGIILEPGNVLARKVENAGGVRFIRLGDVEHFAKGGYLVTRHLPVGFGHLGAQRDDRDPECSRTFRRGSQAFEDNRQRLTRGKCRQGVGYAGPK